MFERFTERARQVVVFSQGAARELDHAYIGTEHILAGLCNEEEGLAARVLAKHEISYVRVMSRIAEVVGKGKDAGIREVATGQQVPFTPRAKKCLELALREALSLGHNYIGTEHILLGLVREKEGVGARFLREWIHENASETLRNDVIAMLSGGRNLVEEAEAAASAIAAATEPVCRFCDKGESDEAPGGALLEILTDDGGGHIHLACAGVAGKYTGKKPETLTKRQADVNAQLRGSVSKVALATIQVSYAIGLADNQLDGVEGYTQEADRLLEEAAAMFRKARIAADG